MRNALRRSLAALALLVGACFDGEELTEGLPCVQNSNCGGQQLCINGFCGGEEEEIEQGGNPCEIGGNVCLDGNTLGVCDLDTMSTMAISCDDRCESSGYSSSIGCRTTMGAKHDCYCDLSTLACDSAIDGDSCPGSSLVECVTNRIEVTDCDEVCQESGQIGSCSSPDYENYECTCSPGACSEGATFCQDDTTEARCVSGVWQLQPCSDAACQQTQCPSEYSYCPEGYVAQTLGCGYDGNGNMACRCTI